MARPPRTITHEGLTLTLDAWAERIGITGSALRQRLRAGWSEAKALSTGRSDGEAKRRPVPQASGVRSTSPGPRDTRLAAALDALRERRAAIHAELSELEVVISTLERHVGAAA